MTTFDGIPQAGLEFIRDLAVNNDREWFQENKPVYKKMVQNPAVELVRTLGIRLQDEIHADIQWDERTNGSGSLMRINRDTRFSKDKSPYKEYIAMGFWQGNAKKMVAPTFGLQFKHDDVGIMTGIFSFEKAMLEAYRQAILDDEQGESLIDILKGLQAYEMRTPDLKGVPRGYDKTHPRAELLRYKGMFVSKSLDPNLLTSPEFVDVVMEHWREMVSLHHWLVQVHDHRG